MYPSKILLFGEYTILLNSQALAIPYGRFKGDWNFMKDIIDSVPLEVHDSNSNLKEFLAYLKAEGKKINLDYHLDISRFEEDLESGIYFKSDIPKGSGLGSSGALVAAVFDRYVKDYSSTTDVYKLKRYLALLESFYHGTSSGIDPLVSFTNSTVLVKGNNEVEMINLPADKTLQRHGLFLIDSGQKGETSELVNYFKQKCSSDNDYLNTIQNHYIPINNECIKELVGQNDTGHFFSTIHELSGLQLSLFEEMIPKNIIPLIKYGLENDLFYLKLCGSGGGGYFLGFSENVAETKEFFKNEEYEILLYS